MTTETIKDTADDFFDAGKYNLTRMRTEKLFTESKEKGDTATSALCAVILSVSYREMGDFNKAERYAKEAETSGAGDHVANVDNLGLISYCQGNTLKAIDYALKAKELYVQQLEKKSNSRLNSIKTNQIAWNLAWLSNYYLDLGKLHEANVYIDTARKMFQETKNHHGLGWCSLTQAHIKRADADYRKVLILSQEAQNHFNAIGRTDRVGWCLLLEACARRAEANYTLAIQHNKKALSVFRRMGLKDGMAWSMFQLGAIYKDKGEYTRAMRWYSNALTLHKILGNRKGLAWELTEIGKLYTAMLKYKAAEQCFDTALTIAEALGSPSLELEIIKDCALLQHHQGDVQGAKYKLERVLSTVKEYHCKEIEIETYLALAMIFRSANDITGSKELIEQALATAKTTGTKYFNPELHASLALINTDLGNYETAQKLFIQAIRLAKKYGMTSTEITASVNLSRMELKLGLPLSQRMDKMVAKAKDTKSAYLEAMALFGLALYSKSQGNKEETVKLYRRILRCLQGNPLGNWKKEIVEALGGISLGQALTANNKTYNGKSANKQDNECNGKYFKVSLN